MKSRRQRVANKYSAIRAERYHRNRYGDFQGVINRTFIWRALVRSLASVPSGSRVLDVPCGTGQFCWDLAAADYSVTGMDVSSAMLDVAARQGSPEDVTLRQGDIFNLPFDNKSFDAAICIRFTDLVDARWRISAIRELTRVARVVVISYSHRYSLKYVSRWLRYVLKLRDKLSPRHSRESLKRELSLAGVTLRDLIHVAPLLSESWLAVLES
jgi:ubiquinone/menaquinone biosynthesis C-methylase UbiE